MPLDPSSFAIVPEGLFAGLVRAGRVQETDGYLALPQGCQGMDGRADAQKCLVTVPARASWLALPDSSIEFETQIYRVLRLYFHSACKQGVASPTD